MALETDIPQPRHARFPRPQIGLRSLCLLLVAIAVWMTYFVNRRQNAILLARIAVMAPLAASW